MTSKSTGEHGKSEVAVVVLSKFNPAGNSYTPVLLYHERPDTLENAYIKIGNIIRHYNRHGLCKIHAEANAATVEHLGSYLRKEGLEKTMAHKKKLSTGETDKTRFFTYVTPDVRAFQIRHANIFFRKYGGNIWFNDIINDLLKPEEHNADIRDAFLMVILELGIDYDKPIVQKVQKPRQEGVWKQDPQMGWYLDWT